MDNRLSAKYDELPDHLKRQVDIALGRIKAEAPVEVKEEKSRVKVKVPNKTEARYSREVLERRDDVAALYYEGLTFRMCNGHRYTPDWVVVRNDGKVECFEVKGSYELHSQQRARLAFDQARVEYPWVDWYWVKRAKGEDAWVKVS